MILTHQLGGPAGSSPITDPPTVSETFVERRRPTPLGAAGPDALPRSTWWVFLVVGAVVVTLYELIPAGVGEDVAYCLISLTSAVAVLFGVQAHRPTHVEVWRSLAVGQLLWVIGDAIFSWYADVSQRDVFPSAADAFYLLGYVAMAFGLGRLDRIHRRRGQDIGRVIDSATVTVGLGLLSWVILAGPTLSSERHSALAAAVSVAYPIADIMLIGLLILLLSSLPTNIPAYRMLILAVLLLVAGDTASSALGLYTSTDTRSFDWIWLASYLLFATAALHPSMRMLTETTLEVRTRTGGKDIIALIVATTIAPGTLAVEQAGSLSLTVWPVVIGCVVMFLLVVTRMRVNIRQIVAANQQRELMREELVHQAAHDSLTQLPNRAQAMRLLEAALHRAQRNGVLVAVLFVDLDGFKLVNDTLGHQAGDEVLREVARILQATVRSDDVVARLGGDEFVVILEPVENQASALDVAERLVASLRPPIEISGHREARIGASVGLALSQDGEVDAGVLLHEADIAVYRAKGGGRGRTEIFNDLLRSELAERARLETEIEKAIREDELVLHFQPVVEVRSGRVDGYEVLVRWNHPERGVVSPAEFIPVAESSELICEIDTWVLNKALDQLRRWADRPGMDRLNVGVNISGRHVARPRILDDVRTALQASGIAPGRLVLEVTETILVDEPAACAHMDELRRQGVLIGIDDFGTGYNSIGRLDTIPADVVKIDKRFIEFGSTSAKLLPLMVQSAHAFNLPVVAEGVQADAEYETVAALGCELAQGFLLAPPMNAAATELWHVAHASHPVRPASPSNPALPADHADTARPRDHEREVVPAGRSSTLR